MNNNQTYNLQSAEVNTLLSTAGPAQLILFCMGSKPAIGQLQPIGSSKGMKAR